MVYMSWASRVYLVCLVYSVYLVHLVYFVYLVDLVYLVSFIQPNKQDKPNKPNRQVMLADCFSILLATNKGDEFLVHHIGSFPLWDVPRLGDSDES